jgi:hypothetical protein
MAAKIPRSILPFKYLAFGEINKLASNRPGWSFSVTLRFGEEVFEFRRLLFLGLTKARVFVGVKCANVVFSLTDCFLPHEDWEFDPAAETHRSVARKVSTRTDRVGAFSAGSQLTGSAGLGIDDKEISAKAKISAGAKSGKKSKRRSRLGIEDEFKTRLAYISPSGGPTAPKWAIEAPNDYSHLHGTILKSRRFARAEITGANPQIEMYLEIPDHGIVVRDQDGIFRGINQQKIARLRIKKSLAKRSHLLCSTDIVEGPS